MQAIKIRVRQTVAVATEIGRILAGKYRLEHALGTGGMGTVIAATHLGLGRKVALKFMRLDLGDDGEAMGRFMREARAAATLRSEHVAQVMDVEVDSEGGAPYIVMEYLEGSDLASVLQARGRTPVAEAVGYVLQACEGLAEAHANGIVHRDLKPANLFLTQRPDGAPLVKVLDFGVSKLNEVAQSGSFHLTQPRKALGSPQYMSPEQMVASREVDQRADIWALGVILYELLSGKPPFVAASFLELGMEVTNRAHPPLAGRVPGLAPGLVAAVDCCLQKTPASRFANLAELAAALVPHAAAGADASAARIARILGVSGRTTLPIGEPAPRPPAPRARPRTGRVLAMAAAGAGLIAGAAAMIWPRAQAVKPEPASAMVAPVKPTAVAPAAPAPVTPPQPDPPAAPLATVPAPPPASPAAAAPTSARKSVAASTRRRHRKPERISPASAEVIPAAAAPLPARTAPDRPAVEEGATRTKRGPVVTDL